jgi:hypothetical protein
MFDNKETGKGSDHAPGGERDIVAEYKHAAALKPIIIVPTEKQADALKQAGGSIPDEHHVKLENGAPVKKEH